MKLSEDAFEELRHAVRIYKRRYLPMGETPEYSGSRSNSVENTLLKSTLDSGSTITRPRDYDAGHCETDQQTICQILTEHALSHNKLTRREIEVIACFFGLGGEESETLTEIGDRFDVSRQMININKTEALQKLQDPVFWEQFSEVLLEEFGMTLGDEMIHFFLSESFGDANKANLLLQQKRKARQLQVCERKVYLSEIATRVKYSTLLSDFEKNVLAMRNGWYGNRAFTDEEITFELSVSIEWVHEIEFQALKRLQPLGIQMQVSAHEDSVEIATPLLPAIETK